MRALSIIVCLAVLHASTAYALSKKEIRSIIKQGHPGARITEIERETYRGQDIWEVDFRHQGEKLEAIIDLDGKVIKIQVDD